MFDGKTKAKNLHKSQHKLHFYLKHRKEMDLLKKLAVIMVGMLFIFCRTVTSVPNTTVTNVLCNSGEYTHGDPFAVSLAYVLADLETVTSASKDYDYYNISPYPNAFAYGHAACNKNLTSPDCTSCLGAAKTAMLGSCPSRIGSRSVLHDCKIRYEQYPFED